MGGGGVVEDGVKSGKIREQKGWAESCRSKFGNVRNARPLAGIKFVLEFKRFVWCSATLDLVEVAHDGVMCGRTTNVVGCGFVSILQKEADWGRPRDYRM